jgi:prophage maintenance system killer protein
VLLHFIARYHALIEGSKRALAAAGTFCGLNGGQGRWSPRSQVVCL